MDPATLTTAAIVTLVITKALEKTGEMLGEKTIEQLGKLMQLLRDRFPKAEAALTAGEQQPLDYGQAVLELGAATKADPEVAQAVQEIEAEAKENPRLAEEAEKLAAALQAQMPTVQNNTKLAEYIKAVFQGNVITGDINL